MDTGRQSFIRRHTRLQRLPFVPEVQLHLADEMMPLWSTIEAEWGRGEGPPFWAFAWAGGLALARYLLDGGEDLSGKRVLDFATGSGVCAIAAGLAGAGDVLAVDIDPFCAEAVALNASSNNVIVRFQGVDPLSTAPPDVDVILAGDICYEEPLAARVWGWLQDGHTQGTKILLGDPFRAHLPQGGLTQLAAYEIPTSRDLEDAEIKLTGVFTIAGL